MKRFYLFLLVAVSLIATHQPASAKIWRVNNNPGKSCDFTTLSAALRATTVKAKDTIHIEGSVTPYGQVPTANRMDTIRKKLVIIGPGYLLSDNPETQHNKETAKVRSFIIAQAAAGTTIAGIEQVAPENTSLFDKAYSLATVRVSTASVQTAAAALWGDNPSAHKIRINADSVTISHSKLFYVDLYNDRELKNITITKCMFNPGLIAIANNKTISNLIISNNYFRNDYNFSSNYWYIYVYRNIVLDFRVPGNFSPVLNSWEVYNSYTWPVVAPTIQNNTFYQAANLAVKSGRLYNNIFFFRTNLGHQYGLPVWPGVAEHETRNNIISTINGSWTNPTAQTVAGEYHKSYGNMLNDGVNFYNNRPEADWFVASTIATNHVYDKSYVLGSASPARDSQGDDSKQRGMFGGLSPYVLSGLFTIPAVWEITIPSYPTGEVPSTGFEVRVKVKSH